MSRLAEHLTISSRYSRSANIERDAQAADALDGYHLTGRVVEVIDRLVAAALEGTGGAWSVTGPYGAGKSSLGIFLDALLGPAHSSAFPTALDLLRDVDASLADRLVATRNLAGGSGFARALVTARAEPVSHTVTRGLERAVVERFGQMPTTRRFPAVQLLWAALDDLRSDDPKRTGPSAGSLLEIATSLAAESPTLLLIDEFGKNIEVAQQQRREGDLYLLQLLAEAAVTRRGVPLFVVTMQHLAFGDYAADADTVQQREWVKIQGRFEDVAFVDAPSQTRQLIARAFTQGAKLKPTVRKWAAEQARSMASLKLYEVADEDLLTSCYPLHPLALAVLPELCRRYGQNERTLFSFLTGPASTAVPAFLDRRELSTPLPTIGLPEIYDFFTAGGPASGQGITRWSEINLRLRDLGSIGANERDVAKSVAVLNLLATAGPMRASKALLAAAHPGVAEPALEALEQCGAVTYRDTTDEYRIWQGTSLDLGAIIDRHRSAAAQRSAVALLSATAPLDPVVATGHSLRTDTLRTFERRYTVDPSDVSPPAAGSTSDGRIYLAVASDFEPPNTSGPGMPVVVHVPHDPRPLVAAAVEVHALQLAARELAVNDDWVARAELHERVALAQVALHRELDVAQRAGRWFLLGPTGPSELEGPTAAHAATQAADRVYTRTPAIRNETLNRVELSSQGAKARRLLLLAMLNREEEPVLGLQGHGPEVAMYHAVLEHGGIHRFDKRLERFLVRRPKSDAPLHHAWEVVENELRAATARRINLNDVHAALQLPPIGMKAGAIPVLVTAVLIATSDEVALYEHGTFRPVLTEAICDRMVRNPSHFEVKYYANANGARRDVIEALATALGVVPRFRKQRVGNVLAIVGELVARVSRLTPHTLAATNLTDEAIAVRDAVVAATEPDTLLFNALPAALGFNSIGSSTPKWKHVAEYAERLERALAELANHYAATLDGLVNALLHESREPDRERLAAQAAVIRDEIINPELRSFVLALEATNFEPAHWIENIATVITRTSPRHWSMDDLARYHAELVSKLASFRRLLILHNETRGPDSKAFHAHRHTVTAADGREDAYLIDVDDSDRANLEKLVRFDALVALYGSRERAAQKLSGWAAEIALPNIVKPTEQDGSQLSPKAVNDD